MKKIFSTLMCVMMLLSLVSLAACGEKKNSGSSETLKFGMGVYTEVSKATNAEGDTNGEGEVVHTVAAVLLDKDGKIVKCAIDTADNKAAYTAEGKFVEAGEFKTKYEQGNDYGMKAYGGAKKEWFEQVDAFISVVEGKKLDEVKAIVAEDGKGKDDVQSAGCTITVSEFVLALEKAVKDAKDSKATADGKLKLGIVSTQVGDSKDATAEADGVNEIDTTFAAAVLDKESKVVEMTTDSVQIKFTFDAKGTSTFDKAADFATKKEKGKNYGMSSYGADLNGDGTVKEWFEQGAIFDDACKGKTAAEISALATDKGYGIDSLQTAGCTININDMIKAAVKAAK